MGLSCSNPVHIDHQYRRKSTNTGVSQGPLWEKHFLPSFDPRQKTDQWRVSPPQRWKLRKLDFGRHLGPCVKKILGCWCCRVTASRYLVSINKHVVCSGSEQKWAEHWTRLAMLEEQAFALIQCLVTNPVHINHQYEHTCRCQAVTTARDSISSQFLCSQSVRSMKSFCFSM